MSQYSFDIEDSNSMFDEEFWDNFDENIDIGQRARRLLTGNKKSKKQGPKAPRKLEDYN